MAAQESFVLDGLELNSTSTTLRVKAATLDPPSPRYMWASSVDTEGDVLVADPLHENRIIELTVQVPPQTTMDLALAQIVAVRDKLKKASATPGGIGLVWTPKTASTSCTFDVLAGEFTGLPINWTDGWFAKAPTMNLRLVCEPYWRGVETSTSTASSGTTPFAALEIPNVPGDISAIGRLVVTDSASQARRHVTWGLQGPATYDAATSLLVESDNLVTSGFVGTQTTATGAYDVGGGNTTVTATLIPSQTIAVCGTGNLSHKGLFRVKARVQSTSVDNQFRLSWRSGDGPMTPNPWVSISRTGGWVELDLGEINVPAATLGTQRWTGQVEVSSAAASPGSVLIDYLMLVPASNGYGVARASYSYLPGVIVGYDQFVGTTVGNALNARVSPAGGTWATSGDATDFVFADNFNAGAADGIESIIRSTTAVETVGRFAILGSTNYTDVQVDARVRMSAIAFKAEQSLVVRWTDVNNHLRFTVPEGLTLRNAKLEQVVAGSVTVLAQVSPDGLRNSSTSYRMRMLAFASGRVIGQFLSDAGAVLFQLDAISSAVATGGTLATGKPGLMDLNWAAGGPANRYVTDFNVSTPAAEPIAIYSGQDLQFRHDGVLREDAAGTYWGTPKSYEGSYVTVPAGTSRVLVKARRNDIEASGVLDDNVVDATTIQMFYTPRGLVVPR